MPRSSAKSDVLVVGEDHHGSAIFAFVALGVLILVAVPLWLWVEFGSWHILLIVLAMLFAALGVYSWAMGPPARIDFQRRHLRSASRHPLPLDEVKAVLLARVERRDSRGEDLGDAWHPVLLHDRPDPVRRSLGTWLLERKYRYTDHPAAVEVGYGSYWQYWMHTRSPGEAIRASHQISRRLNIPLIDCTGEKPALIDPQAAQLQRGATRFISTRPSKSRDRILTNTSDLSGVRRIGNVLTVDLTMPIWHYIVGAHMVLGILVAATHPWGLKPTLLIAGPFVVLGIVLFTRVIKTRAHHRLLRIDPAGIHFFRGKKREPRISIPRQELYGASVAGPDVILVGEDDEIYVRRTSGASVEDLHAVITEHLEQLRNEFG